MRTRGCLLLCLVVLSGPAWAQEELGKKTKEKVAIQWARYESKNYSIEYESLIPTGTVKQIAEELEDVLEQYISVFKFKPAKKFRVKYLENPTTFEQEGGDPSHPGFFNPRSGYLVIQQMPFYELIPTVYHEAFHQYLQAYLGDEATIPTWFNEGLAGYFEGMQRNEKSKKLDSKLIDNRRIKRLQEAIFTRSALPLDKLVDAAPAEFHDKEKEELHYSQSFAFAYFLMRAMGGKPVFQYAEELKKTKDVALANAKIFGKDRKNMKTVEKTWKQYILGVKIEEKKPAGVK